MIICPDHFRITAQGVYDPSPAASENAWRTCFDMLLGFIKEHGSILGTRRRELTLLVGPPGAGKSTWAEANGIGGDIIFDATFSRRIEREPVIQIGKESGLSVNALVFLTPISECIRRNWTRPEDRRVPYPVIASMYENLRREPVTLDEGFDSVEAVR